MSLQRRRCDSLPVACTKTRRSRLRSVWASGELAVSAWRPAALHYLGISKEARDLARTPREGVAADTLHMSHRRYLRDRAAFGNRPGPQKLVHDLAHKLLHPDEIGVTPDVPADPNLGVLDQGWGWSAQEPPRGS